MCERPQGLLGKCEFLFCVFHGGKTVFSLFDLGYIVCTFRLKWRTSPETCSPRGSVVCWLALKSRTITANMLWALPLAVCFMAVMVVL